MQRSGGVNFVDSNPALSGMSSAETVIGQQTGNALNDMRLQELMRTRDAEHAIDQYMRETAGAAQPAAPGAPGQSADLGSMSMNAPAVVGNPPAAGAPAPAPVRPATPGDAGAGIAALPGSTSTGQVPGQPAPGQPTPGPMGAPADLSTQAMNSLPVSQARIKAGFDRVALANRLAGQGFGTEAMSQYDQAQKESQAEQDAALKQQDYNVTNYFKSLENGDTYSAKYWGAKAGMTVSDDVLHDADFQKFMGMASKWKEFYGSDLHGFQSFYQTALKLHQTNDPDAFTKAYQANPPTVKQPKGAFDDKNAEIAYLMKNLHMTQDQAVAAVGLSPNGRGHGGMGQGGVFQYKHDAYLKLHPGDEKGAMAFANGAKQIGYKDAMGIAKSLVAAQMQHGGFDDDMPIEDRTRAMAMKIMQGDDTFADDAPAGVGGGGTPQADPGASFGLAQQAYDAIANGKDANAVKQRYKQMTGQDLPEQGSQ